jgi:hypothetical protein
MKREMCRNREQRSAGLLRCEQRQSNLQRHEIATTRWAVTRPIAVLIYFAAETEIAQVFHPKRTRKKNEITQCGWSVQQTPDCDFNRKQHTSAPRQ